MGYFDSLNLYTYCGNDPLNWIDPWGLCEEISEAGQDPFGFIRDKQVRKRFQDYVEWEKYKDGFPPDYHHEKETLKEKFKKWLEDQEPRGHKTKQNKPWRRVKDIKNKITTTTVGVIAEVLAVLPSDEALYTTGTVSRYVGYGAGAAAGAIVIGPAIVAGGAAAVEAARNVIQNPDLVPVLP
jgi:phage tail tape-measure protein